MLEQSEWVLRHALTTNLEVQMITGGSTGAPHGADHAPRLHPFPCPNEILEVVRINCLESGRMSDSDYPSIGGIPAAEHHGAGRGGVNGLALRGLDVKPAMPSPGATPAEP